MLKIKIPKQKSLGFTLIELLVVISIIALLSSIILASLGTARSKARDAKRRADSKQIETALNLYYNDYGSWPASAGGGTTWTCFGAPSSESCWLGNYTGLNSLETAITPYLNSIPTTGAYSSDYAYNRYLYESAVPTNGVATGSPAGAYLIWMKEATMTSQECQSLRTPDHISNYWYCYEFVGSP